MDKIFKIKKKNKMAEIQDGRYSLGLYKTMVCPHMSGCPLYVHSTKKACFVRLRGCPYGPYIWMPPYIWVPPVYWDAPICLDGPLYVWMAPCMFGCPSYAFLYVWNTPMLGCPCMFGCPPMFGCPLYAWTPQ